jgi:hypothetical protein
MPDGGIVARVSHLFDAGTMGVTAGLYGSPVTDIANLGDAAASLRVAPGLR